MEVNTAENSSLTENNAMRPGEEAAVENSSGSDEEDPFVKLGKRKRRQCKNI
jgi:hypothetical protein